MRILSIIQPSEMGSDFRFDEEAGLWKVNFPAGMGEGGGVPLSTDANNAIGLGTDEGAFISTDLLGAYALTQDNASKKINLYRFPAGTEFNPETATLVSSVNMVELSGIFDDVAIDGDVITFTDADTGLTLSLDTANLQKVSDIVGSDAISVSSIDGETRIEVRIDPNPNNLIQLSEGGLVVDPYDLGGGDLDLHQTLAQVEDGLCHVVGNSHLVVPQIELVDVAGNPIGYINDIIGLPVSSETHGPDHCPKWEAPTANNCRVGKVGVALVEDLPYGTSSEPRIEWEVYFNGQPTGYVAAAIEGPPPMAIASFSVASDSIVSNNRGYMEDIISDATGGMVQGAYNNELCLWNTSTEQAIIKLVPSVSLTPAQLQNLNDGTGFRIFGLNAEQANVVSQGLEFPSELTPPELENLEDYHNAEDGSLTICLAPNAVGNGGSTGPQISCAGATDRFATSGLWNKWTLKINGQQVVTAGHYSDIFAALNNAGVYAQHTGELETVFRNISDSNIRIELIAVQENQWDRNGLELDLSTNPTLMGYDPIEEQMEAFAFNSNIIDDKPKIYRRLTVCLAPANTWMDWDYKEPDTSTAVVTLTNSINLLDANQDFSFEGTPPINVYTGTDKWGDFTWTIRAEAATRLDIKLLITSENYEDEFTVDFLARQPMMLTLANVHDYYRSVIVKSTLDEPTTISSIEVKGKTGFTSVLAPEDGMVIDAVIGALRIDNLETGEFTYILQGRFVDTGTSDSIKVKFVTADGVEDVVSLNLTTDAYFQPVNSKMTSYVTVGVVDNNRYFDIQSLPVIEVESPEWDSAILLRENGVGGKLNMAFDFNGPDVTRTLNIKANVNGAYLAVIGDCVIGVDQWGETEAGAITFNRETFNSRFDASMDFSNVSKNNLSYVPAESPSNMQDMTGMFAGTDLSSPDVDLSAYNVGMVYSMAGVFAHSNFNGSLIGWETRWIGNMDYAFYASKFRQDISEWCVLGVTDEPRLFSHRSPLPASFKPVWGTCPVPGSDTTILRHLVRDADPNEDSGLGLFTLTGKNIKAEDVVIKSDGAVIEATKQTGFNYSLNMATVVFQIRTPAGSSGLITIKHPPLHSFHIDNQNYTNPKHVDVVKFGKNVKGFRLEMPYAFKVPNSIPNTINVLSRMFEGATEFADSENIQQWDVGNVLWMDYAFARCNALNADLRNWCVAKVLTPPTGFADDSAIPAENFPVWGTCPMGSPYIDSGVEPLAHRVTGDSFITTEPMPLLTGRVSHPTAILNVYDDKVVKYTPAVNHGDGTWSCQLDYIKAPTQHRLSVEASSGITNETSGMALMSIVTAEIEGGYWDRATSELVCTSPEGVYLRVMNGRNLEFYVSDFQASNGSLKDFTFCVTESTRTMAQFKENGPQLNDPRIEPSTGVPTQYVGTKGDGNGWSFEVMERNNIRIQVEEYSLSAIYDNRGWSYINHDTPGMNKAIFMHLKPVNGETETRIKLVNSHDV